MVDYTQAVKRESGLGPALLQAKRLRGALGPENSKHMYDDRDPRGKWVIVLRLVEHGP